MTGIDWYDPYGYAAKKFGNYAHFATLLLRLAVLKRVEYSLVEFQNDLVDCVEDDLKDDKRLRRFIRSLNYEDSNFFTLNELR